MTSRSTLRISTALAAIFGASVAQADVTAQQVWNNWTEQMSIYGQGFSTGGQNMSGDTLTVSDVRIEMSDEEATVVAELGDINLTENGDGTVSITVADSYPMSIDFDPQFGEPGAINLIVSQQNMTIDVSGDPDAMNYAVAADEYAIALDSLEGEPAKEVTVEAARLAITGVAGEYSVTGDNLRKVDYDFSANAIDLDLNLSQTGGSDTVLGTASIADIAMAANIALPADMDMDAEMPPFDEGLAMTGGYTFGSVAYAFDITNGGEAASGNASADGGELQFTFDYDGVAYTGGTNNIDVSLLVPEEFPFPIEASLANYGFDIQIPLSQSEDGARDARFAFNFTDLAISDTIWNLVDPQQILPREALTIALGLDATVTPFFDFLDPAQQEAMMMTDIPGELNSVDITALTIRGAGAEITGDGAFTFDNSDLETFDGLPRPQGEVSFAINGVNGLVDKLIQMGLIPQEEAMMPRMMLGMFATPVGDDMLTSKIEVNAEGHVLANGQRLR